MSAFRSGETQVLVATTVVEVGVDVPEATVMVILDAERFGIAQLHSCADAWGGELAQLVLLIGSGEVAGLRSGCPHSRPRATGSSWPRWTAPAWRGHDPGSATEGRSDLLLASLTRDRALLDEARRVARS